ncbi:AP-4 complex subunit epsilon-1-like [Macrobrachium nipponense]|uniref:AP-4 complex subunit epsilon-1-like n=1 Tax=Macrobrachium nipponense TaxID=159736 RepID=UPI0030C7F8BA
MSSVLEKTLSGLVHSILGGTNSSNPVSQTFGNPSGLKNVSFGLVNFVEKLQSARRISKQEEQECIEHENREWVKVLSSPGISSAVVADLLCRALIASVRGYDLPNLHIHAIKLTQCPIVLHKKIGYLYVSQSLGPGSELTLLLVNTIQRDLTAPNALQVAAALASFPTVVTPDLTPSFICSLTHCLAHKQVYIRRRAAAMVGVVASRCGEQLQDNAADQIPHLLHLLTDQDPGVAIAAINSLCKIYKDCGLQKADLREQVAQSASHLLTQALNGALPKDYQVNALPAPFVQMQMLRVIQQISSKDWQVPASVIEAVESVVGQPWGGKEVALYSVLLECVFTITALPHHDGLITSALKVVLGFLKSTNIDLKYVGLKALASVFSVLEEALTPTHLEAVLDCLYHSNASLQAKTLSLLCAMANPHNYQAVSTTLLEFSTRVQDTSKQKIIYGELSSIITQYCEDVVWCIELLSPLIMNNSLPDSRLLESLVTVFEKGFSKENSVNGAMSASQELLLKIFSLNPLPKAYINLIACMLNLHYGKDPKQVSKYFTDTFVERVRLMNCIQENNSAILQCLKNIGLYDVTICADIVKMLQPYTLNSDLKLRESVQEVCTWLSNSELSLKVIRNKEKILNGELSVDLTLSFLDSYVVESLESGASPFKPFSVVMANTTCFEDKAVTDLNDTQWSTPTGSEDAQSSAPSTSTHLTSGTSHSHNVLIRSTIAPSKKIWSAEGRARLKSEGETSVRSRVDSTSQSVAQQGNLLGPDDDEDEVTEGSVEMADEAQEDKDASASQRMHLTQALLSGLGMARTK